MTVGAWIALLAAFLIGWIINVESPAPPPSPCGCSLNLGPFILMFYTFWGFVVAAPLAAAGLFIGIVSYVTKESKLKMAITSIVLSLILLLPVSFMLLYLVINAFNGNS